MEIVLQVCSTARHVVFDRDFEIPPDIFLLCDNGSGNKYYQIWVNNKDAGFSLAKTGSFPSGVQSVSFADIGEHSRHAPNSPY